MEEVVPGRRKSSISERHSSQPSSPQREPSWPRSPAESPLDENKVPHSRHQKTGSHHETRHVSLAHEEMNQSFPLFALYTTSASLLGYCGKEVILFLIMPSMPPTIKLALLGSAKSGKTTAVRRLVDDCFVAEYETSIGGSWVGGRMRGELTGRRQWPTRQRSSVCMGTVSAWICGSLLVLKGLLCLLLWCGRALMPSLSSSR